MPKRVGERKPKRLGKQIYMMKQDKRQIGVSGRILLRRSSNVFKKSEVLMTAPCQVESLLSQSSACA